jgi:hypothetical protein
MAEYANSSIIGGGGFSTNDSPTNPANPPPTKGSEKISKLIKKIKDKLDVIKKLNDDPDNQVTETNDGPLLTFGKKTVKDLKEKGKKKLDDLKSKNAKKNNDKKNIFGEILGLVSVFLVKKQTTYTPPKWLQDPKGSKFNQKSVFAKNRLEYLAHEAVDKTIRSSKNIVNDNVKKILFAGDGICGSSTLISVDSITLSPKEFDMMNILTISPSSNTGQIVYEPLFPSRNLIKMNRTLYSGFTAPQSVESADGKKLFSLNWDEANQYFNVTGLTGNITGATTGITVNNFISDYYSNIEQLDLAAVSKTAMLMVLKGDGSEPPLFDEAMNDLNRLINKLMKVCNNPNTINKSTENQFNEDDEDIEFYFDFDDVEGIDLDDESDRLNKVLRFTDCNNFTIPSNPNHFEDFIYLSKSNINEAIDNSFTNISLTSYQEAGGTIPQINFKLSLLNNYILNLPKALLGCIMSPKYILPIVIIYKITTGISFTVKEIMKKLNKLFYGIINDILWKFISEFWKLVKKDLLDFLKITAYNLLKEKYKKYRDYILSIINLIKRLLNSNLGDCNTLFTVINATIDTALFGPNLQVPGIIDSYAKGKSGFSNLRTLMGVVEQCGKKGFDVVEPVFGQENNLFTVLRATVQQHTKETNNNSYVHVANASVVLPVVAGQVIMPAGVIKSYGGIA